MKKYILSFFLTIGIISASFAQCTTFVAGTYGPTEGPCLEEPVSQNTSFDVWASETYLFSNVEAGATYAVSLQDGLTPNSWVCEFTVFAPSGAIDAFGTDGGNSLMFTATESGTYAFGLTDVALGCGITAQVDNGLATLSYISGPISSCGPPPPYCDVFGAAYGLGAAPCGAVTRTQFLNFEVWSNELYVFEGVEAGVAYIFSLDNSDVDGTGAAGSFVAELLVIAPSGAVDAFGNDGANVLAFTASESGTYSFGISDPAACGVTNNIDNGFSTLTYVSGTLPACPSTCVAPTDLAVLEIGFGTPSARVNGTWTNTEGTTDCEVRGGRISAASYAAGEPEFANINNTQTITQTDGTTVLFNVVLYNNPNVPFIEGQRYGYEVRCQCADGSGFSDWANITPASTFVVPFAPAGVIAPSPFKAYENTKKPMSPEQLKAMYKTEHVFSATKSLDNVNLSVFPNPATNDLSISIDSKVASNMDVIVMDMTGRTIMVQQFNAAKGMNTMNLNIQKLVSGVYVVSIDGVKQTFVKK